MPGETIDRSCESCTGQEAAEDFTAEGIRLSRQGRFHDALRWFSRALKEKPEYPPALVAMGFALGKMGKYEEEIEICDRVLALDETLLDAWIARGFALGKLSRFREKIACLDRALEIDPNCSRAWNARGHAFGELGAFAEEVACSEKALSLRPRYLNAWVNLGYALLKLKHYREARIAFVQALQIYPGHAAAWTNLGITHCHLGEYTLAVSCLREAERLRPQTGSRALYWKGLALSQTGRHSEAIPCLEKVVEGEPRHAEAWIVLSNSHFLMGHMEDSVRCFMVAYGIDKKDLRDCVVRGVTLLREGKREEAMHCLSQVIGILRR